MNERMPVEVNQLREDLPDTAVVRLGWRSGGAASRVFVTFFLAAASGLTGCGQGQSGDGRASVSTAQEAVRVPANPTLLDGQITLLPGFTLPEDPEFEDGHYTVSYEFERGNDADAVTLTLLDFAGSTLGSVTIDPLPGAPDPGVQPNGSQRCSLDSSTPPMGTACLFASHQAILTTDSQPLQLKAEITPGPEGMGMPEHNIHISTVRFEPTRLTTLPDPSAAGFDSAEQVCAECHSEQYQQWRSSMMGYSSISPPIHALELTENYVDRPTINDSTPAMGVGRLGRTGPVPGTPAPANTLVSPHGEAGLFCQRCHAPVAVYSDVFRAAKLDFTKARGSAPDSHQILRSLIGADAPLDDTLLQKGDFDGLPGNDMASYDDPSGGVTNLTQFRTNALIATEGVTCTVCHSINGIDEKGMDEPANLDPTLPAKDRSSRPQFEPGIANNAFRVMHDDQGGDFQGRMNLGPYDDFADGLSAYHAAGKAGGAELVRMGTDLQQRPFIRTGEFCGTCHDVRIQFPDEGPAGNFTPGVLDMNAGQKPYRRVENLFSEWRDSPWNNNNVTASVSAPGPFENPGRIDGQNVKTATTCQDCHMSRFMTHDDALPGEYDMGGIAGGGTVRRRSNHRFMGVDRFLTHDMPRMLLPAAPPYDDRDDELNFYDISQGTAALGSVDMSLMPPTQGGFNTDFANTSENQTRDLRQILLQKAFDFQIDQVGPVSGGVLPVRVAIQNIGAGHNIPSGLSQEREVWIELEVLDANGNNVYTSGYLNLLEDRDGVMAHGFDPMGPTRYGESYCGDPANEPYCDLDKFRVELGPYLDIVDGTLTAGMDSQLRNYENGFTLNGNKVFTQFIADHVDDTKALKPFVKTFEQYPVPVGTRTGPFQVNARLRFRPLPFEFLNGLRNSAPTDCMGNPDCFTSRVTDNVIQNNVVIEVKQDACVSGAYGLYDARACSLHNRVPLALGGNTTCSVFDANSENQSGSVQCFGANGSGQAGIGGYPASSVTLPKVLHLLDVTMATLGDSHGCALLNDGKVYCWGDGTGGKLCDNNTAGHTTPAPHKVAPMYLTDVNQIAAGSSTTCALTEATTLGAQRVRCWGQSTHGEFGDGNAAAHNLGTPYMIPPAYLNQPESIVAGAHHYCAITSDVNGNRGKVKCWGQALGAGQASDVTVPTLVSGMLYRARKLAAGDNFTCALTSSAEVYCWGDNQDGTLGTPDSGNTTTPVRVQFQKGLVAPDGSDYFPHPVDIAAGQHHVCALMSDKTVECWGLGDNGRLGDGATGTHIVSHPTDPVLDASTADTLKDVAFIAAGGGHSCAMKTDGTRVCWGLNSFGELGQGNTTDIPTAAAITFADPTVTGRTYFATLTQGGNGQTDCTSLPNTSVSCTDDQTFVDLNDNTGYKFTIQSDGGPTTFYPSIGVNGSASRAMDFYVDGVKITTVTSTSTLTPRPTPPTLPAETPSISVPDLTPGYHMVEWRDTASSLEFDAVYLRVVNGAGSNQCHDLMMDGLETDVDCGGPNCGPCDNGQKCIQDGHCKSNSCVGGICQPPAVSHPCAAYASTCPNPLPISWEPVHGTYQAGDVGTGTTCREVTQYFDGMWCGNFVAPKQLIINGVALNVCQSGGVNTTPPPPQNGGYCIQTTAGSQSYASYALWDSTQGTHGL